MPTFRYLARNSAGEEKSGSLDARNTIDAYNQLHRMGLRIERLEAEGTTQTGLGSESNAGEKSETEVVEEGQSATPDVRLGVEDLAEIAGRIAGITKSKLPLTPGLRALSEELPSRKLRHGLRLVCDRLEQGEPLDDALDAGGTAIPDHIGGLIALGIRSGRLGEMMEWFLHHVRRRIDLQRRCRASLLYPAILLLAGLIAFVGAMVWIVPGLRDVYYSNDFVSVRIPTLTFAMLTLSDFLIHFGIYLLVGIVAIVIAAWLSIRLLGGKALEHRCVAATPFIGTMFRCSGLAGFCELLSMFVSGELPLPEAIRLAGQGTGDEDLKGQFQAISECLERGEDDSDLFRRLANISPQLIHVFHWKDKGQTFVEALSAAVRIYENQAQLQITLWSMLIEPVVIVGVLGGVGFFAASMFLPLIQLLNSLW